jgi:hypothetical protein
MADRARSDVGRYTILPGWILSSPVSDRAILLFSVIDSFADYDSAECYPSRRTLAEKLGCSESSLDRAKKELEDIGAVVVERRRGSDGDNETNLYHVHYSREGASPVRPRGASPVKGRTRTRLNEEKTSAAAPQRERSRPRHVVWDAMLEIYDAPTSKSETSDFAKTANEVRDALKTEGIPEERWRDEVLRRGTHDAPEFRSHRSLRNRWGELGAKASPASGDRPGDQWYPPLPVE